jgi:hypothetical protein
MAWIIGYVSQEQADELRARGWDVEDAEQYGLIGRLLLPPGPQISDVAIAVWVDTDVMQVFDGPDWDGASESEEARVAQQHGELGGP